MRTPSLHRRRYLAVAAVFCVVCLIFVIRMVSVQITNRESYIGNTDRYTTEYRTVQAVRGEIYDRNGVKLVANDYTYHFVLDYASMPRGKAQENDLFLEALDAMDKNGISYGSSCPFEGTYPDLTVKEGGEQTLQSLISVAKLEDGAGAEELIAYLGKAYLLDEKLYTPEEMTRLIALRCDLLLDGFGDRTAEYTLARDVDARFIAYVGEKSLKGVTFASEVGRTYFPRVRVARPRTHQQDLQGGLGLLRGKRVLHQRAGRRFRL